MDIETSNRISTEILKSCTIVEGKLTLGDETFKDIAARIKGADDPKDWGTMLVALVNRLRDVPGGGPAAERVLALAALALGDKDVAGLVQS